MRKRPSRDRAAHPFDVDERLVMPETPFEIVDGKVFHVPGADPPHAERHAMVCALLVAYVAPEFKVSCDMLTRTSPTSDFAPDASIYPRAPNPQTGGRELEHIAFEIVSKSRLGRAGRKARLLIKRGVRRVVAIDVQRERALEWSRKTKSWEILASDAVLEDPTLAVPLPFRELVSAAYGDDAFARALLAKDNPILVDVLTATRLHALEEGQREGRAEGKREGRAEGKREGRAEGKREGRAEGKRAAKAEALLVVLRERSIQLTQAQRKAVRSGSGSDLDRWLRRAVVCSDAAELFGSEKRSKRR